MVRAVLDSSVLVSGWSRLVLQRLATATPPLFEPIWSEWIIAETWRVLTWRASKRGATEEDTSRRANLMLRYLLPVMHTVRLRDYAGPPPWPGLADADDAPIWATGALAHAQYVVSDNIHDFPPVVKGPGHRTAHTFDGIEYLTAIEFVEDVLGVEASVIYGRELPRYVPRSARSQGTLEPFQSDIDA